ncbi:MAG: hypothetical protein AB1421_04460 [Pseudomonadota bacterium]
MTTKHMLTAGLLLLLAGPAFAAQEAPPAQAPATPVTSSAPAPAPAPVQLAWQRVGNPLSLPG